MKKNSSIFYSGILLIGDFVALIGAFSVAYILRVKLDERSLIEPIPAETFLYGFLTVLPLWILVHTFIGLYRKEVYDNRFTEFGRLILGSFIGMLVVIGYDFVIDDTLFPARLVAVYGFVLSLGFLILFRMLARLFRSIFFDLGYGLNRVLLVGDNAMESGIFEELRNTKSSGHKIVGIVTDDKVKNYKTFKDFESAIKKLDGNIDSIIQVDLFKRSAKNDEVMDYAQTHHISYKFVPAGNNELFVGNIEVELFRGTPVVTVHQSALIGWGSVVKRIFDILGSAFLIIIFLPVFIIITILQKIIEPKSRVFFVQNRMTQYDRQFKVFKFRTHKQEFFGLTDEQAFEKIGKPELIKAYRKGGDQIPNDPRITSFGKFLRSTSIDELPQLFNVLIGDISLVGPRALVPEELRTYKQKHNILSIKSGVTGLAQVSGRREISFEERRKLDLYYVQNWSFWLDVTILLKTLRAVINGIGAK